MSFSSNRSKIRLVGVSRGKIVVGGGLKKGGFTMYGGSSKRRRRKKPSYASSIRKAQSSNSRRVVRSYKRRKTINQEITNEEAIRSLKIFGFILGSLLLAPFIGIWGVVMMLVLVLWRR